MGVVAVVGPTASGKSRIAMALAERFDGEIVSVDSMQVYRDLDVGTAKPSPADRQAVPHHLIDVVAPEDPFSVAQHQRHGVAAIDEVLAAERLPIVAGGSGLHFRALVDPLAFPPTDPTVRAAIETMAPPDAVVELLGVDQAAGRTVDLDNPRRVARALEIYRLTGETPGERAAAPSAIAVRGYVPRLPLIALGVDPGAALETRVTNRFDAMLAAGLLDEVDRVQHRLGVTAAQGVGYKELLPVVRGDAELETGRNAALRATMALAKRQRTFFRRDPRIRWIPWHDETDMRLASAITAVAEALEEQAWNS